MPLLCYYFLRCHWFKVIPCYFIGSLKPLQKNTILVCPHMTIMFLTVNNSTQNIYFGIEKWLLKLHLYFISNM